MAVTCKNCGVIFQGGYCNTCGQKVIDRFTGEYLWRGLHQDLFEIDSALVRTFRELWSNPGAMVRNYLNGATKRYYGPLKYLVFWTAIYFVVDAIANDHTETSIKDLIISPAGPFSTQSWADFFKAFEQLMKLHTNFYYFGLIPFVSLTTYWLSRGRAFNLTEIVILLTYFCGHVTTVFIVFVFIGLTPLQQYPLLMLTAMVIPYVYVMLRMQKQFFEMSWRAAIIRGYSALLMGLVLYWSLLFLLFQSAKYFVS